MHRISHNQQPPTREVAEQNFLERVFVRKGKGGRACVVVLGDLGRSPRMQYQALSLSRQNPPSVPTLIAVKWDSVLKRSAYIIDWHNLGHTLLTLSLGRNSNFVAAYRCLELKSILGRWQMAPFVSRRQCNMSWLKTGISSKRMRLMGGFISFFFMFSFFICRATVFPHCFTPRKMRKMRCGNGRP
ncbi:uncharacterized protein LOC111483892 isoform X2 [Cucurbita maxima]|uniref:Uncharacterized protein LOC111483892 isoform X2 n=1 Tax=Cucurbita maxima TaxID=3661 RepID=A0A6J1JCX9_CUCMA|nr:uncharacterized protein LOC111483892 isoform X2 [Cucurbita maxima]